MNRCPLALALLVVAAAHSAVSGQEAAPNTPRIIAEFDIPRHGEVLSLPVELNGRKYRFLLDTGASQTVFDLSFKDELGAPIDTLEFTTAGDTIRLPLFACPPASIGKLPMRALCANVAGHDMAAIREAAGKDIRGVVGMDFLRHWVVRINPDRGKVSLLSSVDETAAGFSSKLTRVDQAFFLSADIPGWGPDKFLVDTGAVGVSCDVEANLFQWLCECKTVFDFGTVTYEAASGRVTKRQGRLSQLTVGPFKHRGLLCSEHSGGNIVGLDYLSRYISTFDFPNEMAYFRPGRSFGHREPGSTSGLTLVSEVGEAVVHAVDPASPAENAGIEPEDVIVAVPQSNVDLADVRALYDLFRCRKGETLELWVLRGNALLRTTVVPSEDWTWPRPTPEISCCRE
jgi:Aspartyl protease/PDZ domain